MSQSMYGISCVCLLCHHHLACYIFVFRRRHIKKSINGHVLFICHVQPPFSFVCITTCHLSWSRLHCDMNHATCNFIDMALPYMLHSNSEVFENWYDPLYLLSTLIIMNSVWAWILAHVVSPCIPPRLQSLPTPYCLWKDTKGTKILESVVWFKHFVCQKMTFHVEFNNLLSNTLMNCYWVLD